MFGASVTLLVLSGLTFALLALMPGDPVDLLAGSDPRLTPDDIARLKALYGVDKPFWERWISWLGRLFEGEFGYSRMFAAPVADVLPEALWRTLSLAIAALAISTVLGVAGGAIAALKPGSIFDYGVNLLAFAGVAAPSFWLALMGMALFSITLGWLPASALPADPDAGFFERARHLILPIAVLAALETASILRHARAAVGEALSHAHVQTARSKGLSDFRIIWRHVLPNAMTPLVTVLALDLGALASGAVVVEVMFGYPGMGKLLYDAILGADYNLAMAVLLLGAGAILIANAAADVAYAALDPRIGFGRTDA
jgi:peptide/nickel transport system permease protein